MNWIVRVLLGELHGELRDVHMQLTELKMQQAEMLKVMMASNQTLAKLMLTKANEPEELSNAERAALIGLPPSMADLVDWDQVRGRR